MCRIQMTSSTMLRDVVEDVISCEALGPSGKDMCDHLVAACVVIEEIGRETYR
jgi:hypothetical protein